jgi:hypothetical protein
VAQDLRAVMTPARRSRIHPSWRSAPLLNANHI